MVGQGRGHVDLEDGVLLEGVVLVALGGHADGVADDAVADLELGNAGADGGDDAGNVLAEHGGVVQRPPAGGLERAIDGVDGDGVVLDEDLVSLGSPHGSGLDHEGAALGRFDPGSVVGGHFASRVCKGSKLLLGRVGRCLGVRRCEDAAVVSGEE